MLNGRPKIKGRVSDTIKQAKIDIYPFRIADALGIDGITVVYGFNSDTSSKFQYNSNMRENERGSNLHK